MINFLRALDSGIDSLDVVIIFCRDRCDLFWLHHVVVILLNIALAEVATTQAKQTLALQM